MKAYWYAKWKTGVMGVTKLGELVGFMSAIPSYAQVWVPPDGTNRVTQWYTVNARNRLCAVSKEACKELRTALLIQGVVCP